VVGGAAGREKPDAFAAGERSRHTNFQYRCFLSGHGAPTWLIECFINDGNHLAPCLLWIRRGRSSLEFRCKADGSYCVLGAVGQRVSFHCKPSLKNPNVPNAGAKGPFRGRVSWNNL
jgi:hypothetical protein